MEQENYFIQSLIDRINTLSALIEKRTVLRASRENIEDLQKLPEQINPLLSQEYKYLKQLIHNLSNPFNTKNIDLNLLKKLNYDFHYKYADYQLKELLNAEHIFIYYLFLVFNMLLKLIDFVIFEVLLINLLTFRFSIFFLPPTEISTLIRFIIPEVEKYNNFIENLETYPAPLTKTKIQSPADIQENIFLYLTTQEVISIFSDKSLYAFFKPIMKNYEIASESLLKSGLNELNRKLLSINPRLLFLDVIKKNSYKQLLEEGLPLELFKHVAPEKLIKTPLDCRTPSNFDILSIFQGIIQEIENPNNDDHLFFRKLVHNHSRVGRSHRDLGFFNYVTIAIISEDNQSCDVYSPIPSTISPESHSWNKIKLFANAPSIPSDEFISTEEIGKRILQAI